MRARLLISVLMVGLASQVESATQITMSDMSTTCLTGVDLNSPNTDFVMSMSYPSYIARRVTITKASTSLAGSPVTFGLFSQPAGGGVAAIPLTAITGLNSTTRFIDVSLSAFTVVASLPNVYFRVGAAHGSPATLTVCLEVTPIP